MPSWARVFVLLTGMIAWIAIVAVSLFLRQIPSAVIVGFPAALWIALAGGNSIARRRANRDDTAAVEAATDQEGDPA
jgi:hypothetical protein